MKQQLKIAVIVCTLLASLSLHANDYYVSPSGNDSNAGTQVSPWKTFAHAILTFTLGPSGTTIHAAQGTYNETVVTGCVQGEQPTICISRGGTASAPLTLQCDSAKWTVPSSSTGCKINYNSSSHVGISLGAANYVTIKGPFEFAGSTTNIAIIAGCDGNNPTTHTGLCPNGNGLIVDGVYIHDMGQTDGCSSTGAIQAGPSHGSNAYYNPAPIIRNSRFQHIGNLALARKNGGTCNQYHAVYISAPDAQILNDVFLDVVSFSIHAYSYPCRTIARNNTVVRDGASGGVFSGGDCTAVTGRVAGLNTVTNNISIDGGNDGFVFTTGTGSSCTSGTPNFVSHNILSGNPLGDYNLGTDPSCTQVTGTIHATGDSLFVHYLGSASTANGNDDLHLKAGSAAIRAGTTSCATGVSCPDATDADGASFETQPSIGAYSFGGSVPPPPTGNQYYVSPSGSDSNSGSQVSPWRTLGFADAHLALATSGDTTVHVAACPGGSPCYGPTINLAKNGNASHRIIWQSDIRQGAKINGVVNLYCSYCDFTGFDVENLAGNGASNNLDGINTNLNSGSPIYGTFQRITHNVVHDVFFSTSQGTGSGECAGNSGINIASLSHDILVDSNIVKRVGKWGGCPTSGGGDDGTGAHGIYVAGFHNKITNNQVSSAAGYGIESYHNVCENAIANNLLYHNFTGGIQIAGLDGNSYPTCSVTPGNDDYTSVNNNLAMDNGFCLSCPHTSHIHAGILFGSSGGGSTGSHNKAFNNFLAHNFDESGSPINSIRTYTGNTAPTAGGNIGQSSTAGILDNYQSDGSGDYHPASGSPVIGAGTSSLTACASAPGISTGCIPTVDFDGTASPSPPSIGAYNFGGSVPPPPGQPPLAPTGVSATVQ